jgi:hypothetical protein
MRAKRICCAERSHDTLATIVNLNIAAAVEPPAKASARQEGLE